MKNVIKINIRKKEDYTSKFNDDILSSELSNYIMDECRGFSLNSNIRLEITSKYAMNDSEKNKLVDMIRSNFGNDVSEILLYRKKGIIIDFLMIGFGAFALIFYIFSSDIPILSELILIFSWILIGESLYNLIFTGFSNMIDMKRRKKLTNCDIIFK